MTHVITANFQGNPNIGLFCFATNKYCLVPHSTTKHLRDEFHKILKVPVYELRAAGTDLLGVFLSGNDDILLVPEIMFDSELKELKRLGIKYAVVESELTALGNNLLFTENGIIANPTFDEHALKSIEKNTGLKVKVGKINELEIVGSLCKSNTVGFIVSPDIREFELKFLKTLTKQKITKGTLNFGSPNVSSAFIANKHGFIVGEASGGPEIVNLDEALGFSEG